MPTDGVIGPSPRRAVEKAFLSKVRATDRDFTQKIVEKFGHGGRLRPEVKDAAEEWATMCSVIAVSGGGKSSFADSGGYPSPQQIARELEEAQGALEVLAVHFSKWSRIMRRSCVPVRTRLLRQMRQLQSLQVLY